MATLQGLTVDQLANLTLAELSAMQITEPIHHWKLDETSGAIAEDSAGSADGTLTGGLSFDSDSVEGATAGTGQALSFDGSNDYIEANVAGLQPPMTVAFWVRNNLLSASATAIGLDGFSDAFAGISFLTSRLIVYFSASNFQYAQHGAIVQGEWAHVVVSMPSSNGSDASLFVNGSDVGGGSSHSGSVLPTNSINLGRSVVAADRELNGELDDVRIYDYALDASEAGDLYRLLSAASAAWNVATDTAQGVAGHIAGDITDIDLSSFGYSPRSKLSASVTGSGFDGGFDLGFS